MKLINKNLRVILVTISLAMLNAPAVALQFGTQQTTTTQQPNDEIILVINKESISRQQLQRELRQQSAALPQLAALSAAEREKVLLERVIMKHLMRQLVEKLSEKISDEDIDEAIATIARENSISVAVLLQKVSKQTALSTSEYRKQIAADIALAKFKNQLVLQNINISDEQVEEEINKMARLQNANVHIEDLLVIIDKDEKSAEVIKRQMMEAAQAISKNNNDLRAAAAQISNAHYVDLGSVDSKQIPVRFSEKIVNLNIGEVVEMPIIDSDGMHFLKLSQFASGGNFQVKQANIAQIFLQNRNPQEASLQGERAANIYKKLTQGADFAQLARKSSEDRATGVKGGDMGWLNVIDMPKDFAAVVKQTAVGSFSKPFVSSDGWHIIYLKEYRHVNRREEILQRQVREKLFAKAAEDLWQQRLNELRAQAYIDVR